MLEQGFADGAGQCQAIEDSPRYNGQPRHEVEENRSPDQAQAMIRYQAEAALIKALKI